MTNFLQVMTLLGLTLSWAKGDDQDRLLCSLKSCTSQVKITTPPPPDVQISSDVQDVLLRHITNRIMVTFHQTQRYTAICEFAKMKGHQEHCNCDTREIRTEEDQ
ncbi:uncharacterized protein LOC113468596 [Diaphorina citri]|uniref:Uncharacterized protein LOC113468596 n=1 Tax=Diaphorina citri TaxID=121845 RepID=A0A3Q0J400_DIACI|nr:uncharacterized protein LOC113468596 [Diaphorina citri]